MGQRIQTFFRGLKYPVSWLWALLFWIAAVACVFLGIWQWERAEIRAASVEEELRAEQTVADPSELGHVLGPQEVFTQEKVGVKVVTSGEFTPDRGYIVESRVNGDGKVGVLVVNEFVVAESQGKLPLVVGWLPDEQQGFAALENLPEGPVQVEGYLQASESAGLIPAGEGRVSDAVSSAELVNWWGGPIYSGYLTANEISPGGEAIHAHLEALPLPQKHSVGLNLQNLGYALQWWVFSIFAVAIWVRMVYDQARNAETLNADVDGAGAPVPAGQESEAIHEPSTS